MEGISPSSVDALDGEPHEWTDVQDAGLLESVSLLARLTVPELVALRSEGSGTTKLLSTFRAIRAGVFMRNMDRDLRMRERKRAIAEMGPAALRRSVGGLGKS